MSLLEGSTQSNIHPTRRWRHQAAAALSAAGHATLGYDLVTCGDINRPGAVVFCDACGNAKLIKYTCHSRLCPDCERKAQAERLEKYLPLIAASIERKRYGYKLRHVTITTNLSLTDDDIVTTSSAAWRVAKKALDIVLFDQLKRWKLLTDEEKRRKLPNWKKQLIGAVAGGEFGEGLRFHMHFFIYSPFIHQKKLTAALKLLTAGKWYVNYITAKNHAADAKEVVAKYATKLTELPPTLLPKLQTALAGQRRVRNYGCWFGVPPDTEQSCGCKECGNRLRFEAVESALEWSIAVKDVDAWYTWRHEAPFLLNLKHGNKLRETVPKPAERPWLHLL